MRTIIFGVDGLTFRVLHPLIERGRLPNFQKLSEKMQGEILNDMELYSNDPAAQENLHRLATDPNFGKLTQP